MAIGRFNFEPNPDPKTSDFDRSVARDKYVAERLLKEEKAFEVLDQINGVRKIYRNTDNSLLYFEDLKDPRRPDDLINTVYKKEKGN